MTQRKKQLHSKVKVVRLSRKSVYKLKIYALFSINIHQVYKKES